MNTIHTNMRTNWVYVKRISSACIFALLGIQSVFAATTNSLEDISFNALPGNKLQITLRLEQPASEPLSFTINDPARIALDLLNTKNNLSSKTLPIGLGLAESINTAESKGRTRVVLNLAQMVPYTTEINGNNVYLTVGTESAPRTFTAEAAKPTLSSLNARPSQGGNFDRAVTGIDFHRGDKGEGRVIITLSDAGIPVDVNEDGGRLIVDFIGSELPENLRHRLDVLDFATPVKTIDSFKNGRNTRLQISTTDNNFEHLAYQSDNIFTLEIKPIPKEVREQKLKEKFGYTGKRLNLNFQDIEVRSLLQLIADFTGLNVVVSDTVGGNLTLRLKNVPWDQALDIILSSKGLAKRQSGNVLMIAPTEEIATREKLELEALQQVRELAPLKSAFIRINYAKAAEMAALLSGGGEGGSGSMLSERGKVSIDERTNTLLVQDTAEKLSDVRALINRLDVSVPQVLIESRIVIASDDFNKELGVRFGVARDTINGSPGQGTVVASNLANTTNLINGVSTAGNNLNVNLGTNNANGSIALALGKLPTGTLLELELSALQSEGRGEIVSSPRVITTNQKEAFIEQGVEIPYVEASSSGAATISFKKAVLSLKVTPQITPDNRVIMDLTVNKDSVGVVFAGVPSIDTREVNTQVLVNNGETVVLGGIFEQETLNQVDKVPFFGDLPGLGKLFRRNISKNEKTELLIFVTPKIVKDSLKIN